MNPGLTLFDHTIQQRLDVCPAPDPKIPTVTVMILKYLMHSIHNLIGRHFLVGEMMIPSMDGIGYRISRETHINRISGCMKIKLYYNIMLYIYINMGLYLATYSQLL